MGTLIRFFLSKGFIFCMVVALVVLSGGCAPPPNVPIVPIPEDYLIIHPVWYTRPDELQGQSPPIILIDPNNRFDKRILEILGVDGPGQSDPKEISDWGNRLMAWGDEARPYVWFHPRWSSRPSGSSWAEMAYLEEDHDLFQRWFEEADLIIIEGT